jgi:hypothetical protein
MVYELDGWVSNPSRGNKFSLLLIVQTPPHTASYTKCVKRPECEADHSPVSIAEVKNGGAIPPLCLHGVVLN